MSDASMQLLANRSFPELSQAVRAVTASTAASWERAVRDALPKADQLTIEQLRDDLPKTMSHVADALASTRMSETNTLADAAPIHGSVRYEQGFNLDELMLEYSLLRETVVVELTTYLKRNLQVSELMALGAAMDITVRRSVGRFVEHLTLQLKAVSEAQSKYLSFLSHDLRGGLNGVFLMIEVLKRELAGEEELKQTMDDLDMMRRSLLEVIGTMDRFLHAERFRKGKVQVRPAKLNVRNLLNEIAAHFSYQAKEKNVSLEVEMPTEASLVSDKELLMLIFQNLVSNAIKFSPDGAVVRIAARCLPQSCRISIIDQGPGIAADKLPDLFTAFSRGETHGKPGVGLGLNIASQAAGYLNAKLWAESTVGQGAAFILELANAV